MTDANGTKYLTAARLCALLATLPADSRVMPNTVGNPRHDALHSLHRNTQPGASNMNGNQLSLGRNHSTADSISMTEFGGFDPCFRVEIKWNDGGHVYVIYDTKAEALVHVRRLGWA